MVAHNLKSVETADQIIFIENGEVIEEGTHPELMAKRGCYHHFYQNCNILQSRTAIWCWMSTKWTAMDEAMTHYCPVSHYEVGFQTFFLVKIPVPKWCRTHRNALFSVRKPTFTLLLLSDLFCTPPHHLLSSSFGDCVFSKMKWGRYSGQLMGAEVKQKMFVSFQTCL